MSTEKYLKSKSGQRTASRRSQIHNHQSMRDFGFLKLHELEDAPFQRIMKGFIVIVSFPTYGGGRTATAR